MLEVVRRGLEMVFWKKWRMIVRNVTASRSGGCFVGMSLEGGESLGDNVGRGR